MSGGLPAVPKVGSKIAARDVEAIERHVAEHIRRVDDIEVAVEWRSQALALEAYLRSKNLHGPMLGAQRRVEARIGELLGEAKRGGDRRSGEFQPTHAEVETTVTRDGDRADFRTLAHGFNGCSKSQRVVEGKPVRMRTPLRETRTARRRRCSGLARTPWPATVAQMRHPRNRNPHKMRTTVAQMRHPRPRASSLTRRLADAAEV